MTSVSAVFFTIFKVPIFTNNSTKERQQPRCLSDFSDKSSSFNIELSLAKETSDLFKLNPGDLSFIAGEVNSDAETGSP